jgi:UDP-glucose 4-epimerase
MKNTLLVTGAGGYIGSTTSYLLLQAGFDIVTVDNYCTGFRQPLELLQEKFGANRVIIYDRDFTSNLDDIFESNPDIMGVVDFAASLSVSESMHDPNKYFFNNVCGNHSLLSSMLKFGVKNIVFSSTCTVYGESQYMPVDEVHPLAPNNVYGESKRMVERMIEWYSELKGLNFVILRYFNVCGASDDSLIGDSKRPSVHLIQNAVRGALGLEEFKVVCAEVDTPDKTPIRDYTNVVDLGEAHILAIQHLLNGGKSEHINIGTGTGNSVMEIVRKTEEVMGVSINAEQGERRLGEASKITASISKAKEVLGWEPKHTLEQSILSLKSWYEARPGGWDH